MTEIKKGRKFSIDPLRVAGWRQSKGKSIAETAKHFGISPRTVTNYCRDHGEPALAAREIFTHERRVAAHMQGIADGDRSLAELLVASDEAERAARGW